MLKSGHLRSLYGIFEPGYHSAAARVFRVIYGLVLTIGLSGAILASSPDIFDHWRDMLSTEVLIAALFFFAEYLLRLMVPPSRQSFEQKSDWYLRWRWMRSLQGLVDLAAVIPFMLVLVSGTVSHTARLVAIVWTLKLFRFAPGARILGRVFRFAWEPLFSVFIAFIVVLLTAATLIHLLEGSAQPATYGSIPLSLWWTIVTLTTTGYGDATPITPLGRVLASGVMVCGIAVFALWAGILANAFANEVRRGEFLRNWDLINQVPMFRDLGTETIADISHVLRSRDFARGTTVFRRGERGECMYFIVSGEVEVQASPTAVVLGAGQFFGEIALISGEPRSASTVATRPTQLLILDIADFREVAARRPNLATAVHNEAERRVTSRPTQQTPVRLR